MLKRFAVILLLAISTCLSGWSFGRHYVDYYDDVTGGIDQTWSISPYNEKYVFFANNDGVLQYDGNDWTKVRVGNSLPVRSVFSAPEVGRVFVGAVNEFGYITPDATGRLVYTSISDSIPDAVSVGNVWGIYENDGVLYVQGDNCVIKFARGKSTLYKATVKIDCSNLINGVLLLGSEKGLYQLNGNVISKSFGADVLENKRIRSILSYDGRALIVTDVDGIYSYDGHTITKINNASLDERMRRDVVSTAAIKGDILALGTIHDGVIMRNLTTGKTALYNESTGLQDNTILSLAYDPHGNLWIGLDNTINCIKFADNERVLQNRQLKIGNAYAVSGVGDLLYLGTNRGLYTVERTDSSPVPYRIHDINGQVWGVKSIGGETFCMQDNGLYVISGGQRPRQIGPNLGVWTAQPFKSGADNVWVGCYQGMYAVAKHDGQWRLRSRVSDITESVYNFVQVADDDIMYLSEREGVVRVTVDLNTGAVLSRRHYDLNSGLPSLQGLQLAQIDDKIYAATPQGAYRFDAADNKFVADEEMNYRLGGRRPLAYMRQDGRFVYAVDGKNIIRGYLREAHAPDIEPISPYRMRRQPQGEMLHPVSDSIVIMPTSAGSYILVNVENPRAKHSNLDISARINRLVLTDHRDSVVYRANFLDSKPHIVLPYNHNSLRVEFGASSLTNCVNGYRFRLNGGEWSDLAMTGSKEFTDMREGHYTFDVEAQLYDGSSVTDSITFEIRPPWYRSWWAFAIYAVIAAALILSVVYSSKRYLDRNERRIIARKQAEIDRQKAVYESASEKKDKQISDLESEKLQTEIDHKTQEISNLLMMLSSKNEALIDLKEQIHKVYGSITGNPEIRRLLLTIQTRIDHNIQSDDILKRVEKEFDLVHNDFTKRLRREFPDLSNSEVMMCAYIKMNLLTKEIAPLLNISVRGVETMRYRIRKKFGLERDASLSEFLMRFDEFPD